MTLPAEGHILFLMKDEPGKAFLRGMADDLTAVESAFRTAADAAEIGKNVEVDLDRATLRSAGSFLLSLGALPESTEEDDQPDNAPAIIMKDPEKGYVPGNVFIASRRAERLLDVERDPAVLRRAADFIERGYVTESESAPHSAIAYSPQTQ